MSATSRLHAALRSAGVIAGAAVLVAACGGTAATSAPTAAASAVASAAPASAAATSDAASAEAYEVAIAQDPKLGAFLTGEDGKSLYLLTSDTAGKSTCSGGCATAWPPFVLDPGESVAAGTGVTGALSTLTRADDGKQQVTYNGIPLYYFAKDAKPGDVNGQGIKGVWFLVAPASTAQTGAITGGVGQAAAAAPSAAASAAAAGGDSAQIANFAFSPATLTVKVGTTVTWTNTDTAAHTVTADDGSFNSSRLATGATFQQAFATAGTFTYHCAIHSSMKGTVTVTP